MVWRYRRPLGAAVTSRDRVTRASSSPNVSSARSSWSIIINAITLGIETSDAVVARYGDLLHYVDRVALGIFVVELALRLYAYPAALLPRPVERFDLLIVGISLAPRAQRSVRAPRPADPAQPAAWSPRCRA
jgi:hypothetical protein